jgi:hypothetical protein
LESAFELLGEEGCLNDGEESCLHCSGFQAAINKSMSNANFKKDESGQLWMIKHCLQLPFDVLLPDYYDKRGKAMDEFLIQGNGCG